MLMITIAEVNYYSIYSIAKSVSSFSARTMSHGYPLYATYFATCINWLLDRANAKRW